MADGVDPGLEDALREALSQAVAATPDGDGADPAATLGDALATALRGRLGWGSTVIAPDRVTSYSARQTASVDVEVGVRTRFTGRTRACVAVAGDVPDALARAATSARLGAASAYVLAVAGRDDWNRPPLSATLADGDAATARRLHGHHAGGVPLPARFAVELVAQVPVAGGERTARLHRVDVADDVPDLAG